MFEGRRPGGLPIILNVYMCSDRPIKVRDVCRVIVQACVRGIDHSIKCSKLEMCFEECRRHRRTYRRVSKASKIVERLRRSSERRRTCEIVIYVRGDPVVASPALKALISIGIPGESVAWGFETGCDAMK